MGKKCEPVCVLNGKGGVGIEGVKCEEGDMGMAGLRMWVMAMEPWKREATLKWVTRERENGTEKLRPTVRERENER